jgi:hypothetical protein
MALRWKHVTLQVQVAQSLDGYRNVCPDGYVCRPYEHDLLPITVEFELHNISSGHLGQQSPGANGNGLSHANGGHSNFQQSYSPYCGR